MKNKREIENEIIRSLEKIDNVSLACERTGISRQTFYRWSNEDKKFREKWVQASRLGYQSINDLAMSKLVSALNKGESWAVKFRLKNYDLRLLKKRVEEEQPEQKINQVRLIVVNQKTGEETDITKTE